MNKLSAIILVGGKGTRLKGLTKNKTKSYVSFLGKYRIIDFPLSSISYSKINEIALITQYEPYDLMKYIGSGSMYDIDTYSGGISYLTPFEGSSSKIRSQLGTSNAVLTQINYIKRIESEYILILSGDQIYNIDFRKVLDEHIKNKASLTILSTDIDDVNELKRYGVMEVDDNNRIISFKEKPNNPKSNHISLGIYLFNKSALLKYLVKSDILVDFGKDLIPYIIGKEKNVYRYYYDSIFMDLGTIESLYNGNMYFLDNKETILNGLSKWKVYSRPSNYPPFAVKSNANIIDSYITNGCIIDSYVKHSIISIGVILKRGSSVIDSVILPDTTIGENTKIKNAIVDEGLVIKDNLNLEFDKITLVDEQFLKEHQYV